MAEPIKQDTLGQAATVGNRALIGGLIGAVAVAAIAAGGGYFLAGSLLSSAPAAVASAVSTIAGVVAGAAGLYFGGVGGALVGGAAGGLSGMTKVSEQEAAYDAQVRKQHRALQHGAGAAKDQGFQEGVMTGYQQAAADMQQQQQMVYQQGLHDGANHVVEQIQQQQAMMAQAQEKKGSFADKVGCKPCASKAEAVEAQKAELANQSHGLV